MPAAALFRPSAPRTPAVASPPRAAWKVLVADDEAEVHTVTAFVLKDFEFEDRPLHLLHAYSAREARALLERTPDVALALLDVVMESDHAGLDLVREVREELRNTQMRIVLRTGQPGQAPEEAVIRGCDINDYKNKTELTAVKLKTMLYSALRSYRDIRALAAQRAGLERTCEALAEVAQERTLERFATAVLMQLTNLIRYRDAALYYRVVTAFAESTGPGYRLLAASGDSCEGLPRDALEAQAPTPADRLMREALARRESIVDERHFVGYFRTHLGGENLLYLSNATGLTEFDHHLLRIFCNNVAAAYENLQLHQEIEDSQRELIYVLGEAVEKRSRETGGHVKRVALISEMLARDYGLEPSMVEIIKHASPLHDAGKVGIPDRILNKPGRHTEAEWEIMKTHTRIGHEMLARSDKRILRMAAVIALQHHEHWDGGGYPQGLKGTDIHVAARVTALADVFDALGSLRCYKRPWTIEAIVELLHEKRGRQFEPRLTDLLLARLPDLMDLRRQIPDEDIEGVAATT